MTDTSISSEPLATTAEVSEPSTKRLALHGTVWTVIGYGLSQVLRLGSNLILTRLLAPSMFGVMALVQVTMQGLQMFSDIGVGWSVIRAKADDESFLNTAWTIQFLRGWALWLGCAVMALPVARFYHVPVLGFLLVVSGFQPVIDGLQSMSLALENKKLAIKNLTLLALAAQIIGLSCMVTVAFITRSVWALIVGGLVNQTVVTLGSYFYIPAIWPRIKWDKKAVHEIFTFGKWIFVSTMMTFLAGQVDRFMLGKLVPLAILGVYAVAMNLATLPNSVITHIAGMILYPILAKHAEDDRAVYVRKVLKARRLMLPVAIVIVGGLATAAQPFFHWLYDSRYADAGWMAQLLTIYIWFWMLQASADRALVALGDTRSLFVSNVVNLTMTLLGCLVGYHLRGMFGFIIGLSLSSLCGHLVVEVAMYLHGINIVLQDIGATVIGAAVVAAALGVGYLAGMEVPGHWRQTAMWIVPNLLMLGLGLAAAVHVRRMLREIKG
jgi:O-antigen/teichoic acid export membrane protein